MSKLNTLRRQLASLCFWRKLVRWTIGYSALLSVVLWTLVGIFAVDLFFFKVLTTALDVPQRLVLLLIAVGGFSLGVHYLTRPFLGVRETETEMALIVEQQHEIESDLVAALQFESTDAMNWGSRQLEDSVIDYVAQLGPGLDTFKGFDTAQLWRRVAIFVVSFLVLSGACVAFPGYAAVFFNRLAMGEQHYPTRVTIDHVVINHNDVFLRHRDGTVPQHMNAAQGQPLVFDVRAFGRDDRVHNVAISSANQGAQSRTVIELTKLSASDRLERLKQAAKLIHEAREKNNFAPSTSWQTNVTSLLRFDAEKSVALITNDEKKPDLKSAEKELSRTIKSWNEDELIGSIYSGQLERMIDPIEYSVNVGDAWTDAALVSMTPLPIVEPHLKILPPKYAAAGFQNPLDPTARQLSVLEGSRVEISIECTNKKSLASASIIVKSGESSERYPLKKASDDGTKWSLPLKGTPFNRVTKEMRFEIQATDTDGLQMLNPINGYIRLKMDRGPTGTANVVRNVFLPKATPMIDLNVHDDYGVSEVRLHLALQKGDNDDTPATDIYDDSPAAATNVDIELESVKVVLPNNLIDEESGAVLANQLPFKPKQPLSLLSLQRKDEDGKLKPVILQQGDRLKVTLEVVDYRGKNAKGTAYQADPLFLEIGDVSEVFAANAKDDERADKAFEDIKNKILE